MCVQLFYSGKAVFRAVLELLPESDCRVSMGRQFPNCHFPFPSLPFIFATKLSLRFLVLLLLQTKLFLPLSDVVCKGGFLCLIKEMLLGHSFLEFGMQLWHNLKRSNWIIRSSFAKELIWTASLFSQLYPLHSTEVAQHCNWLFSSCLLPPFSFFCIVFAASKTFCWVRLL